MKCKNCETNDAVKYSKYTSGEFCSKSCANSFSSKTKRADTNKKISLKLKGRGHGDVNLKCQYCKKKFIVGWRYRDQIFCSISCNKKNWMKEKGNPSEMGKKSVSAQNKTRRSKNEIYFGELCKNKFSSTQFNKPIFNGWDADIIIPELKLAVLWNGKWHYEKITKRHSLEQVQRRDKIKLKEIKKEGYVPYVIKDMGKYDKSFVENNFKEMLVFLKLI